MPCPVLASGYGATLSGICCAMPGIDIGSAATRLEGPRQQQCGSASRTIAYGLVDCYPLRVGP
eukprot:3941943-Rhodomonas_salina.7